MKSWILLFAGLVLASARPTDDETAASRASLTQETSASAGVIEGTTVSSSSAPETTEKPRNWLALLLGEDQYSQPEAISQEAAARPKISGYGRRRRSGDDVEATAAVTDVALDAVKIRNHGQYGELSRRQSPYGPKKLIVRRSPAGKKKTTVYETAAAVPADDSSSYDDSLAEPLAEPAAAADSAAPPAAKQKPGRDGGKKSGRGRRDASADKGKAAAYPAAEVFLVEVDSDTVKIRNRGKYGNIAQAASGPVSSRLVFDDHFGKGDKDQTTQQQRRLRRGTAAPVVGFIPFSEYDSRRVQILKVEQNDFMALPKRLAAPPVGQNANQQND